MIKISWLTILVIFWESWQGSSLSVVLKIIAAECVIQALKLNSITEFLTRGRSCLLARMFMNVHVCSWICSYGSWFTLSVLRQVNTRILDSMITLGPFTLNPFLTCLRINKQDTFYTRCSTPSHMHRKFFLEGLHHFKAKNCNESLLKSAEFATRGFWN